MNDDDDNTLLDALTQNGVLISVSVRYWRACKKLNPEDLGLTRDKVDARLFSLGHKKLLPQDALKQLAVIESRAHALVAENTFPFLNGVAHYLPNTRLEEVTTKLATLQQEFEQRRLEFLGQYMELKYSALRDWQSAAAELVDDPAHLVEVISRAFPSLDRLGRYFSFDTRLFQITIPTGTVPQAEYTDIGKQRAIIDARREAALNAREEIEKSCREFIGDCVSTLREQTATLCQDMLATIHTTGSVNQKTLNRLTHFLDRFKNLNFTGDREMAEQLESVRREFLEHPASEYRDSNHARHQLVQGLTRLREKATELATQDARELVENFGRMGRRRFTLAA